MKCRVISVIFLITLLGCVNKKDEIIINGNVIGENITKIEYTSPLKGNFNGLMTDSISPDSSGNFRIVIPLDNPGFIILKPVYNTTDIYKSQGIIIAEPGYIYDVTFDANKDSSSFYASGYNEEAINTYNKLSNPLFLNELQGAELYMRDSVASSIREKISSQKDKEIGLFKKMFDEGKISESFFDLIETDRNCYYATVTALIVENKYSITTSYPDIKFTKEQRELYKCTDEIKALWEEAFKESELLSGNMTRSPWWSRYAERFILYKLYTSSDIGPLEIQELGNKNLNKTFHIENCAKKYLPDVIIESYFANYIYRNCFLFREYNDNELLALYNQFTSEFPESEYTRFISPWIDKYKEYQQTVSETELGENINFIKDYHRFNTLEECLLFFKDKKVYVDVWATWCAPCRMEFNKCEKLTGIIRSKGIEILYISIDEDKNEKSWNDMIKYYNLEGYHIRASSSLCKDLEKVQKSGKGLYIPWHMFFDEKGSEQTIPSEIADLYKD